MPGPYIDTPRANDGQSILDNMRLPSPDKSFVEPKQKVDLISQMRGARVQGMNLGTPRRNGRDPLRLLPNGNQGKSEFTPLLKSVAKTNMSKRISARRRSGSLNTPGLSRLDDSNMRSEHTGSSVGNNDYTPMPQNLSSSAASTPMAQLPMRDAGGVLNDGNVMTLREQENIIDKIEKENFGLKMKIHFLEEALSKRGSEFNQAALKENTDLKVNRITMQRELHKFKKTIAQAERDADLYRQQLEEYRERVRRKHADDTVRVEMEALKNHLQSKDAEVEDLQSKFDSIRAKRDSELQRIRDELADLQAEMREKERQLEERDDEIDTLKSKTNQGANDAADLEDELETVKQRVIDLENDLERASQEVQNAKEEVEEAEIEKRRAEQDLDELRDEMANKSFTTKGLSRQLEEKVDRLEEEQGELQDQNNSLKLALEEKTQSERNLQEQLRDIQREESSDVRHLQQKIESSELQRDTFERKYNSTTKQIETITKELHAITDEKDLLQTRHDSLTIESQQLQGELNKAQQNIASLDDLLNQEKQRSAYNDQALRAQHKTELEHLTEQIDELHRDLNSQQKKQANEIEQLSSEKRALETAARRAEEKAFGLQRTIDSLQDAQGTLSGRELKLQEAAVSEEQRHLQEEKILNHQIEELNADLVTKRTTIDAQRTEVNNAKEELRISIREQAALREKVAELEDEIEVLQADIEQEHDFAQQLHQKSNEANDSQLSKLKKEKLDLQSALNAAKIELETVKRERTAVESERDEFELKLEEAQKPVDDTFDMQQERRELRRVSQKLEKDLEKLCAERDALTQANKELEEELDIEIDRAGSEENRLNAEILKLQSQQATSSDAKDRELNSAKAKVTKLEGQVQDLVNRLENQSKRIDSPDDDYSNLHQDLEDARKSEAILAKNEADLKATNRDLKMKVNDLERELHEARLAQLKSRSPSATPSPTISKEVARLRKELVDAQLDLKNLQHENRELRKSQRTFIEGMSGAIDTREMLKSKSAELDHLAAKFDDQTENVSQLRKQLNRIRAERDEARNVTRDISSQDSEVYRLRAELKQLKEERTVAQDLSVQLSTRNREADSLKSQLKRLREERSRANQKAEDIEAQLDLVQARYENILEKLTAGSRGSNDRIKEKEIKGLMKEVLWLKARCRREERLRKDLAWSKTYLEQSVAMRVQCNQVDLRILRDMGINVDRKKYEKPLKPVQKFRAGVYTVMAAIRMSNLEAQWREAKQIGEELRDIKRKQSQLQSLPRMKEI